LPCATHLWAIEIHMNLERRTSVSISTPAFALAVNDVSEDVFAGL
jgi:hypothetical protein